MPTETTIETHDAQSRRLIADAERELANGDKLQASENAWGAVSHRLMGIAERRGWEYETHQQVFGIVKRIADELSDPQIEVLFYVANGMHRNYCVDSQPIKSLRHQIGIVKDLLAMLDLVE